MIHSTINKNEAKGWFIGPWNSKIDIPIGYANQGINEKHFHLKMYEIYLIAKGTSVAVVNGKELSLKEGDMLIVEPGEAHTFIKNSDNYLHFVIHSPFVKNDKQVIE